MTYKTFRELLPLYVVGALDDDELLAFERYVAENRESCEPKIAEYRQMVAGLAQSDLPTQPPARVWERISEEIERETRRAKAGTDRRMRFRWWLPWGLSAVLAVLLCLVGAQLRQIETQRNDPLALAQERVRGEDELLDLLRDPAILMATLTAPSASSKAVARGYWHNVTRKGVVALTGR